MSRPPFLRATELRYDCSATCLQSHTTHFLQLITVSRYSSCTGNRRLSNPTMLNTDDGNCPSLNAFALTIYKVQGLSLPSVTLALNKSIFSDGQAYVGLSRATTSEKLFLTQLDFDAIKADPEAVRKAQSVDFTTQTQET